MNVKLPRGPAIGALLWENWRCSRVAFAVALAIGLVPLVSEGVLVRLDENNTVRETDILQMAVLWGLLPFFLFGLVLLFSLGDMRELSTRIPRRHAVLPVAPSIEAVVHLAFRLMAMSLLVCAQVAAAQGMAGIFRFYDYWAVLGVVLPIFLVVQCLAWTAGNLGVVPFLISMSTIPLGAIVLGAEIADAVDDLSFQYSPVTLFALWTALNVVLSSIAVAGSTLWRHVDSRVTVEISRKESRGGFANSKQTGPLTAHTRFEWVERGYFLPSLTFAVTTFALTFVGIAATAYPDGEGAASIAMALALVPLYISPATAAAAGIRVLIADRRMMQDGLGAYLYSHPLSTRVFAQARLRMSLRSVLMNQLLCLACFFAGLIGLYAAGGPTAEHLPSFSVGLAVTFCLLAVGHTLIVWTMFWMGVPAIGLWFWYLIVAAVCGFLRINESHQIALLALVPASLLSLAAMVYAAKRSTTLGLLDRKLVMKSAVVVAVALLVSVWIGRDIMTLLAAGLSGPYWYEIELGRGFVSPFAGEGAGFRVAVLCGLVPVVLCPAFPILAQPLLVHRLRHR